MEMEWELPEEKKRVWHRKNDWKDFYLPSSEELELGALPEGFTLAEPLRDVEWQRFDEGSGEWVRDPEAGKRARAAGLKAGLAEIDREAGAGRAVRCLALAAAEAAGLGGEDYGRLLEWERRAEALRAGVRELETAGEI